MSAEFRRRVPVRWGDCDPARIVFHPHFFRWMDEGFDEMCLARGIDLRAMVAADPAFRSSPLVDVRCAFRSPAAYGDVLDHRIHPAEFAGGKAFTLRHGFWLGEQLVAEGEQVRIWGYADATGRLRAVPVPPELQARMRGEPG